MVFVLRNRLFLNLEDMFFVSQVDTNNLFLLDDDDRVVTRDASDILARLKCSVDEPPSILPKGYNGKSEKVLDEIFKPEVLQQKVSAEVLTSHTVAQKYALKELRLCYAILNEEDGELKKQVAKLSCFQPTTYRCY